MVVIGGVEVEPGEVSMEPPCPARRRWRDRMLVRLSVRTMMVLVLVIGGGLGWIVHRARVQREAVAAIRRSGGFVDYDWQLTYARPGLPSVDRKAVPKAPRWLVAWVGEDYFGHAVGAVLGEEGNDATMAQVGRLSKLTSLGISRTRGVTDAGVAHLAGLLDLEQVNLQGLKGTGASLALFRGHAKLKGLHIDKVPVTDADLVHLEGLSGLENLDLSATEVTDAGLAHLEGLVNLQRLALDSTRVNGPGLAHLGRMTRLRYFTIRGSRVSDLSALPPLPALESLYLDGTRVGDEQMPSVANLPKLSSLSLKQTEIGDAGLVELQPLEDRLTTLVLSGTKITNAAASTIVKFGKIRVLLLDGTKVGDAAIDPFARLKGLQMLDVSGTAVTDAGLARLRQSLPGLKARNQGPSQVGAPTTANPPRHQP